MEKNPNDQQEDESIVDFTAAIKQANALVGNKWHAWPALRATMGPRNVRQTSSTTAILRGWQVKKGHAPGFVYRKVKLTNDRWLSDE